MKYTFLLFALLVSQLLGAQVTGTVQSEDGEYLSYVNIYVKGSSVGTTTNIEGQFNLKLEQGSYEIVFQYVGYRTQTVPIILSNDFVELDIRMQEESYDLEEVVISADAEDPAYAIIRKAQAKRKYYKDLTPSYKCDAYVRGFNKILDAPEKILGFDIGDMEGMLDSTRQGVVYLSESVSELYKRNGDFKEVMISSKVSGDDQGYSFNSAKEMSFDFYENYIDLNKRIITPIASGAMTYYEYKLEGTTIDENGQWVNKIKVIPKNEYGPCFYGYIYINEDLWNINSIELGVTSKSTQLSFIDSLTFTQSFIPLTKDNWMPFSNVINFKMQALGFVLKGTFAAVYSNYITEGISEDIFNNEVFVVQKEANERDETYWDTLRPIPLTREESIDYVRKDSIRIVRESPEYLDSIDKINNKFKLMSLIGGYSYRNSNKFSSFTFNSPLADVSVNTVQGWNGSMGFTYRKGFDKNYTKAININGKVEYAFSEKQWRPELSLSYRANRLNNLRFQLSGGKAVQQINRIDPITDRLNFIMTLFFRRNYMKLYDKEYLRLAMTRDIGNNLFLRASFDYEDRSALTNIWDGGLFYKDSRTFTDNIPVFEPHQALIFRASLRIKIGEKVWRYPDRKFRVGSAWPTFWVNYKKGLPWMGGDVDYDLLYASMYDNFDLGIIGNSSLYLVAGDFIRGDANQFIDYFHFLGNQTHIGYPAHYDTRFLLLPYYSNSTNGSFSQIHLQHNFNGYILNKLPLFRELGWQLCLGYKYLNTSEHPFYDEYHIGLDNIGFKLFRLLRFDFVWARNLDPDSGSSNRHFGAVLGIKAEL
ncbi:MAG: carboxypeptidase-like regulatory domain-containing protein [Saprospiraceae bacterium]|nr:carboxypeptidase-like regulatory domain-containing protein [Saprospiraceae bacterium]